MPHHDDDRRLRNRIWDKHRQRWLTRDDVLGDINRRFAQGIRSYKASPTFDPTLSDQPVGFELPEEPRPGEWRHMVQNPGFREGIGNGIMAVARGAAEVPISVLDAAGILMSNHQDVPENTMSQAAERARAWMDDAFPMNPELAESFWYAQFPSALGSMAGFVGSGGAGGVAAATIAAKMLVRGAAKKAATKVAQEAAQATIKKAATTGSVVTSAGAGMGGYASSQYRDALREDADLETAKRAAVTAAPIGILEVMPVMRVLGRYSGNGGNVFTQALNPTSRVGQGFAGAIEEGIQESIGQVGANKVAQSLYDADRELAEGVFDSARAGGAAGFLMSFALSGLGRGPTPRVPVAAPDSKPAGPATWPEGLEPPRTEDGDIVDIYGVLGTRSDATGEEITKVFQRRVATAVEDGNQPRLVDLEFAYEHALRRIQFEHRQTLPVPDMAGTSPFDVLGITPDSDDRAKQIAVTVARAWHGGGSKPDTELTPEELANRQVIDDAAAILMPPPEAEEGATDTGQAAEDAADTAVEEPVEAVEGGDQAAEDAAEADEEAETPTWQTQKIHVATAASSVGADGEATPVTTTVVFPDDASTEVVTRNVVVDVTDLTASNDPVSWGRSPADSYPPEIQGRAYIGDRGKSARDSVNVKAAKLNPSLLVTNSSGKDGPPIVTESGTVVAGNSRTMMLKLVYGDDGYAARREKYRERLLAKADELGLDRDAIAAMERPALVRMIDDDSVDQTDAAALQHLNRLSDADSSEVKDPISEAKSYADALRKRPGLVATLIRLMDDKSVSEFLSTSAAHTFLDEMVKAGIVLPSEANKFRSKAGGLTDVRFTDQGRGILKRMIEAAAVGSADTMDGFPKVLRDTFSASWGLVLGAREFGGREWDLVPLIALASEMLQSDSETSPIEGRKGQPLLTGESEQDVALDFALLIKNTSSGDMRKKMTMWKNAATANAEGIGQMNIGLGTTPTPQEAFKTYFGIDLGEGGVTDIQRPEWYDHDVASLPTPTGEPLSPEVIAQAEADADALLADEAAPEAAPAAPEAAPAAPEAAPAAPEAAPAAPEAAPAAPEAAPAAPEAAPVVHTTIPTVTGKVTKKGRVRKMDLSVNGEVVATAVAEEGGYAIDEDVSHPMVADFLPPDALHGEYAGAAKAATREMKTKVMAAFKEKYPDAKPPPRARRAKKPKPFKYRTDPIELYVPEPNPVLPDVLQTAKLESRSGHPIELPDDAPYERALLLLDLSQDPDVQTVAKDFLINEGFPDDMVYGIARQTRHHVADAFERQDPKSGEAITLGRFTVIKPPQVSQDDALVDESATDEDELLDAGEPESDLEIGLEVEPEPEPELVVTDESFEAIAPAVFDDSILDENHVEVLRDVLDMISAVKDPTTARRAAEALNSATTALKAGTFSEFLRNADTTTRSFASMVGPDESSALMNADRMLTAWNKVRPGLKEDSVDGFGTDVAANLADLFADVDLDIKADDTETQAILDAEAEPVPDVDADLAELVAVLDEDPEVSAQPEPDEEPGNDVTGEYVIDGGVLKAYNGTKFIRLKHLSSEDATRVKHLVRLASAVREVIALDRREAPWSELHAAQVRLRQLYKTFTDRYGPVNKEASRTVKQRQLDEDGNVMKDRAGNVIYQDVQQVYHPNHVGYYDFVNSPFVRMLDEPLAGGKFRTADIFRKRLTRPALRTPIKTVRGALWRSELKRGRIDISYMQSQLPEMTREEIKAELVKRDFAYMDPAEGRWIRKYVYLSGNVRKKLAEAKLEARRNPAFARNVKALEAIQPKRITAREMVHNGALTVGSQWIPPKFYMAFAKDRLGVSMNIRIGKSGAWRATKDQTILVDEATFERMRVRNPGGSSKPVSTLFREMLRNSDSTMYLNDDKGKIDKKSPNREATREAESRKRLIQKEFIDWVLKHHGHELSDIYNQKMNHTVLTNWSGKGDFMKQSLHSQTQYFRGRWFRLRGHQLDAVWRILSSGNTLLAHATGMGKTITMITAAMEAKNMGVAKKPLLVVPNQVIDHFAREFLQVYPTARILVGDRAMLEGEDQLRLFADATANHNWDAVIMAHSTFDRRLQVSPELMAPLLQEQEQTAEEAQADTDDEWQAAAQRSAQKAAASAIEEQAALDKQKSGGTWLDDMGFDMVFVDEAHAYKGLSWPSAGRVGINKGSQRAMKMLAFTGHIESVNPGRGVVFATATPVVNAIQELYTILRYLAPSILENEGYGKIERWANDFVLSYGQEEYDHLGRFESKHRPRKFNNIYSLSMLFRRVADVVMGNQKGVNVPPVINPDGTNRPEVVEIQGSPGLRRVMKYFVNRWEMLANLPFDERKTWPDNWLSIFDDARSVSRDSRMIRSDHAPEGFDNRTPFAASKVAEAATKIHELWQKTADLKGVQLVFTDRRRNKETNFDLANDLRGRLERMGVPGREIKAIDGNTPSADRTRIIDAANRGEVRVVIGSTGTLGTGVNVQRRVIAAHNLDAPFTPSEVRQREGRVVRQGNKLFDENKIKGVRLFNYIMTDSADAKQWQILENKARFIEQLLLASRDIGAIDASALDDFSEADFAAMIKSLAVTNPHSAPLQKAKDTESYLEFTRDGRAAQETSISMTIRKLVGRVARLDKNRKGAESARDFMRDHGVLLWADKNRVVVVPGAKANKQESATDDINRLLEAAISRPPSPIGDLSPYARTRGLGTFKLTVSDDSVDAPRSYRLVYSVATTGAQVDLGVAVPDASAPVATQRAALLTALKHARRRVGNKPRQLRNELIRERKRLRQYRQQLKSTVWTPADQATLDEARATVERLTKLHNQTAYEQQQEVSSTQDDLRDAKRINEWAAKARKEKAAQAAGLIIMEGSPQLHVFREAGVPERYDIDNSPTGLDAAALEDARKTYGSVSNQIAAAQAVAAENGDQATVSDIVAIPQLDGSVRLADRHLDPVARAAVVEKTAYPVNARVDIRGQRVDGPERIFRLLRGFARSKTREILTVVYVRKDSAGNEVVVATEAITSGVINRVGLAGADVSAHAINKRATAFGATKVYAVHNHPSGNPTPSRNDQAWIDELEKDSNGSHEVVGVVIDSNLFTTITPGASKLALPERVEDLPDDPAYADLTKPAGNRKTFDPKRIVSLVGGILTRADQVGALYVDSAGQAVAYESVDPSTLGNARALKTTLATLGAKDVILVARGKVARDTATNLDRRIVNNVGADGSGVVGVVDLDANSASASVVPLTTTGRHHGLFTSQPDGAYSEKDMWDEDRTFLTGASAMTRRIYEMFPPPETQQAPDVAADAEAQEDAAVRLAAAELAYEHATDPDDVTQAKADVDAARTAVAEANRATKSPRKSAPKTRPMVSRAAKAWPWQELLKNLKNGSALAETELFNRYSWQIMLAIQKYINFRQWNLFNQIGLGPEEVAHDTFIHIVDVVRHKFDENKITSQGDPLGAFITTTGRNYVISKIRNARKEVARKDADISSLDQTTTVFQAAADGTDTSLLDRLAPEVSPPRHQKEYKALLDHIARVLTQMLRGERMPGFQTDLPYPTQAQTEAFMLRARLDPEGKDTTDAAKLALISSPTTNEISWTEIANAMSPLPWGATISEKRRRANAARNMAAVGKARITAILTHPEGPLWGPLRAKNKESTWAHDLSPHALEDILNSFTPPRPPPPQQWLANAERKFAVGKDIIKQIAMRPDWALRLILDAARARYARNDDGSYQRDASGERIELPQGQRPIRTREVRRGQKLSHEPVFTEAQLATMEKRADELRTQHQLRGFDKTSAMIPYVLDVFNSLPTDEQSDLTDLITTSDTWTLDTIVAAAVDTVGKWEGPPEYALNLDKLADQVATEIREDGPSSMVSPETDYGDVNLPPKPGTGGKAVNQEVKRFRLGAAYAEIKYLRESLRKQKQLTPAARQKVLDAVTSAGIPRTAKEHIAWITQASSIKDARAAVAATEQLFRNELRRNATAELRRVLIRAKVPRLRPEAVAALKMVLAGYIVQGSLLPVIHGGKLLQSKPPKGARMKTVGAAPPAVTWKLVALVESIVRENAAMNELVGKRRFSDQRKIAEAIVSETSQSPVRTKRKSTANVFQRLQTGVTAAPGNRERSVVSLFFRDFAATLKVLLQDVSPTLKALVIDDLRDAYDQAAGLRQQFLDPVNAAYERASGEKIGTRAFETWRTQPLTEIAAWLDANKMAVHPAVRVLQRDEAIALLGKMLDPRNRLIISRKGFTLARLGERVIPPRMSEDEMTDFVMSLEQALDAGSQEVAKTMFKQYNGSIKKALNAAWVEVFGFETATVPKYWPGQRDMSHADTSIDPLVRLSNRKSSGDGLGLDAKPVTVTSWAHLKSRMPGDAPLAPPLEIGSAYSEFMSHASHVSRISAYLAPVWNIRSVLGKASVKQVLRKHIGNAGVDRIWDTVTQQTTMRPDTTADAKVRTVLRNWGAGVLAFRLSPVMLTAASLPFTTLTLQDAHLPAPDWVRALRKFSNPATRRRMLADAVAHSPYWRDRYEHGAFYLRETTGGAIGNLDSPRVFADTWADKGLKPLQWTDAMGGLLRWAVAETSLEEAGQPPDPKRVGKLWRDMMFDSENSSHALDHSGALLWGKRNPWAQAWFMFMSPAAKIYSNLLRGHDAWRRGDKTKAKNALGAVAFSITIATAIRFILKSDWDDDEPAEKAASRALAELTSTVPILGAAMHLAVTQLMDEGAFIYPASATEDIYRDGVAATIDLMQGIDAAVDGELEQDLSSAATDEFTRAAVALLELQTVVTGIPAAGPIGQAKDIMKWFNVGDDRSLRARLKADAPADILQENRRLLKAAIEMDQRAFRKAVAELTDKRDAPPTANDLLAVVNRRFGYLSRFEGPDVPLPDNVTRGEMEVALSERDEYRDQMLQLAGANYDLLSPSPQLPARPRSPVSAHDLLRSQRQSMRRLPRSH